MCIILIMENSIGNKIKEKRVAAGLTQQELAERTGGCSKAYISAVERGRTEISEEKARGFAEAFGCDVGDILGESSLRKVGKPGHPTNNESYIKYAKIRDSKGLTDSDVAAAAGIRASMITHWKLYGTNPKDKTIEKVAAALGVEAEDFFVKDDGRNRDIGVMLKPLERDVLYKFRHASEKDRERIKKLLGIDT